MGIGWVQVDSNNIINTFSAQTQLWPSSYKAELISILSALCTCQPNSQVQIFTDSQSIISKYNKLISQPPLSHKSYSYNYWPIWHTLLNFIKTHSLSVSFYKVAAHGENIFNNTADSLARNHESLPTLIFQPDNIYNPSFILRYKQFKVEQPTRRTIKNICNAHIIAMWSSQNCIQHIIPFSTSIDWQATWLFLNNNQKRSSSYTNFQLSSIKSFRIKNLLNILPTSTYLYNLYPNKFTKYTCPHCNQNDSYSHWLYCSNQPTLSNIIQNCITQIITAQSLNLDTIQVQQLQQSLLDHHCLQPSYPHNPNTVSINTTLQGFIPTSIIDTIRQYTNSYKIATHFTVKLLIQISQHIYQDRWKPYCIHLSQWKQHQNTYNQTSNTYQLSYNTSTTRQTKRTFTYNCICGLPDQHHNQITNSCPPLGLTLRKIEQWSSNWINYSMSTNSILFIQI